MSERNIGHSPDSSFRISSAWLCRRLDNGGCLGVLFLVFCPMFSSKHSASSCCSSEAQTDYRVFALAPLPRHLMGV